MTSLKLVCTAYLPLHLLGLRICQYRMIHLGELGFPVLRSFITVVGLTCNTRAVSRIPLAFMAIATIGSLMCGD
jgi:hypothetical protein